MNSSLNTFNNVEQNCITIRKTLDMPTPKTFAIVRYSAELPKINLKACHRKYIKRTEGKTSSHKYIVPFSENRTKIGETFGKSVTTIGSWIDRYETKRNLYKEKLVKIVYNKFGVSKRQWIVELFKKQPMLHLDEASLEYFCAFGDKISASSISLALNEVGMTYKVIERRAKEIRFNDVMRFCDEMEQINWSCEQSVFLVVSLNGDDMLRKRGFGNKGERFATEDDIVYQYPGQHSIWVLDGARIHCSPDFIHFLKSMGIIPIFLPAYCPFLNPIDVQQGSPLKDQFNNAILELLNKRQLEKLKEKWWKNDEMQNKCDKPEDQSDGISIQNIGGVFIVIFVGIGLACATLVFEYWYYKYRKSSKILVVNHEKKLGVVSMNESPQQTFVQMCTCNNSSFITRRPETNKKVIK
uniref:CSON004840 protein n=1 Tax=Culicoides sonorensis TaxID=179676 RepID=A0A336K8E8_CULSO